MKNLLFFSDHFRLIGFRIRFIAVVIFRFSSLLFKKNRKLKKAELAYSSKIGFSNSYFNINYSFQNVLWSDFNGIRKISRSGLVLFDASNIPNRIVIVAHGFFQKKVFTIEFAPRNNFKNNQFKVNLFSTSRLKYNPYEIKLAHNRINLSQNLTKIPWKSISDHDLHFGFHANQFELQFTKYQQNDFI